MLNKIPLKLLMSSSALLLCSAVVASAQIPEEEKYSDYKHIVSKDPFAPLKQKEIVKQVVKAPPPKVDWVLKGATKMQDGWLVVISNKKTPRENVIIRENQSREGVPSLISVMQNKNDYKKSSIKVKSTDGREQIVSFDDAALKVAQTTLPASSKKGSAQQLPFLQGNTTSRKSESSKKSDTSSGKKTRRIITTRRIPSSTQKK